MENRIPVRKDKKLLTKIWKLADRNPKWSAADIQKELRKEYKANTPAVRTIQDVLDPDSKRRSKYKIDLSPESNWNLIKVAAVNDFPATNDAIPAILEFQSKDYKITIRRAKWITILYPVIKQAMLDRDHDAFLAVLSSFSFIYTDMERISEKAGVEFDSAGIDKGLLKLRTIHDYIDWLIVTPDIDSDLRVEAGKFFCLSTIAAMMGLKNIPLNYDQMTDFDRVCETDNPCYQDTIGMCWLLFARALYAVWLHNKENWENLPLDKKDEIVERIKGKVPQYLKSYLEAIQKNDQKAMDLLFLNMKKDGE